MTELKPIEFRGDSLRALKSFPDSARRRAGFQLNLVQQGRDPDDWKPIKTVGPGVREIRIRDERGIFRVIYVSRFGDTLFVLHCFQKKTQKTSATDIDTAARRYKELQEEYPS
jgi:phage-related protein